MGKINPEADEISTEDLEASEEVYDRLKGDDPAVKMDEGKPRYDLIDAYSLEMLARTYEFGTRKYEENDWRKGVRWGRTWGSIMRHLYDFWKGEDLDPESGLPHLAHAVWQIFALMFYSRYGVGTDDRVNYAKLFEEKAKKGKKRRKRKK